MRHRSAPISGVSALTGVSQSYILFQATQYDTYGYLFSQPKFISLDPQAAAPSNLQISGIRLGVNGVLAPAGQAYSTLSVSVGGSAYTAARSEERRVGKECRSRART